MKAKMKAATGIESLTTIFLPTQQPKELVAVSGTEIKNLKSDLKDVTIIEDTLSFGLNSLFATQSKGKTALALQMSRSVITGESFLGKEVLKRGKVLYFALEDSDVSIKNKLQDQGSLEILGDEIYFYFEIATERKILESEIRREVEDKEPVLVIIDNWLTYATLYLKRETNNAKEMAYLVAFLNDLAREHKLAILLIMHTVKPNQYTQSGPIAALGSQIQTAGNKTRMQIHTPDRSTYFETWPKEFKKRKVKVFLDRDSYVWTLKSNGEDDG